MLSLVSLRGLGWSTSIGTLIRAGLEAWLEFFLAKLVGLNRDTASPSKSCFIEQTQRGGKAERRGQTYIFFNWYLCTGPASISKTWKAISCCRCDQVTPVSRLTDVCASSWSNTEQSEPYSYLNVWIFTYMHISRTTVVVTRNIKKKVYVHNYKILTSTECLNPSCELWWILASSCYVSPSGSV